MRWYVAATYVRDACLLRWFALLVVYTHQHSPAWAQSGRQSLLCSSLRENFAICPEMWIRLVALLVSIVGLISETFHVSFTNSLILPDRHTRVLWHLLLVSFQSPTHQRSTLVFCRRGTALGGEARSIIVTLIMIPNSRLLKQNSQPKN